jgi:hypothetical protein
MSNYSANASNKSPNQTPPHSPPLPIPFNPVQTIIAPQYLLLSPQMTLNTLTNQTDLNETVHAIAYGLVLLRLTFSFYFLDDSADSCDRVLLLPDSFVRLTHPDPFRRPLSLYLTAY